MSRIFKFRTWHDKGKQMDIAEIFDGSCDGVQDDPLWHVMQFTGLLDKNGKDIYEGDIVKVRALKPYKIEWRTFEDGEYGYPEGVGFNVHPQEMEETEVIGNIYENADLLGDKVIIGVDFGKP